MRYTERGRAELDRYLARVDAGLAGRSGVDASDVVAGIEEHVETELARRSADPATAEDVAEVLELLGPADAVGGADAAAADASAGDASAGGVASVRRGTGGGVLVLLAVGFGLLATTLLPLGVGLIVTGLVIARLALPKSGRVVGLEGRVLRLVWQAGAGLGVLAALLLPAALVWGQSQTGGLLEGRLAEWIGADAGARSPGYWLAVASLVGATTGVWWVFLGLFVRAGAPTIRRALGPARSLAPVASGGWLLGSGVVLALASLVGLVLS